MKKTLTLAALPEQAMHTSSANYTNYTSFQQLAKKKTVLSNWYMYLRKPVYLDNISVNCALKELA